MTWESLQNRLLVKLQEEYQGYVLNAFWEMDKTELIWHVEAYLWLEPFYQELREQLAEQDISLEALHCLWHLENTLNTVFTEYHGSSIVDFINGEFVSDLKNSFPFDSNRDAPQPGMRFS